jgi:hypothetical protein
MKAMWIRRVGEAEPWRAARGLPELTKSLKGIITAKRANAMPVLTGSPFWREESYDYLYGLGR